MATKKKKATRTTKKTAVKTTSRKAASRTKCKDITPREKWHVYIVTSLSIVAAVIFAIDTAIMIVA